MFSVSRMKQPLRQSPVVVKMPDYGIFVGESIHHPAFRMNWRIDDYAKVIIAFSGEGALRFEDTSLRIDRHVACAVPAGKRHRLEDAAGKPLSIYLICIDIKKIAFRDLAVQAVQKLQRRPVHTWQVFGDDMLKQMLYEQTVRREGYREIVTGLTSVLLARLLREASSESRTRSSKERVAAYAGHMDQHFFLRQSLDEAARYCGLSRRRFTQLFREVTGRSWNERLIELRIGHACRLLEMSNGSIQSVAFECGFDDMSHFYRTFNSRVGSTPLQFRENSR